MDTKEIVDGDWACDWYMEKSSNNNQKITIVGDGEQRRDFTHVVDICDQLYKVGVGNEKHEALGVRSGINYSVNEVYGMFKEKFGSDCIYIKR